LDGWTLESDGMKIANPMNQMMQEILVSNLQGFFENVEVLHGEIVEIFKHPKVMFKTKPDFCPYNSLGMFV